MTGHSNNFDLIRLIAAIQVMVWHTAGHLGLSLPEWIQFALGIFPGVPIFFVISGYLVSASFRRTPMIGVYFVNRSLRIFPGLWVCFIFGLCAIFIFGQLQGTRWQSVLPWIGGNIIGLPHTPEFLSDYGTGSFNGSLWTIPVELQFYILLPFILIVLGRSTLRWLIAFTLAVSLALVYQWYRGYGDPAVVKLARYTVISWLYMFMLGMMLHAARDLFVQRFLVDRLVPWFLSYVSLALMLEPLGFSVRGNNISPLTAIPLACVVISAAFTRRELATRLLARNDISYGVYLYHMPVVNISLSLGWKATWTSFLACVIASTALAWLSWRFVERPVLAMKSKPVAVRKEEAPRI